MAAAPAKTFTQGVIYISKTFWSFYGIHYDKDKSSSVIIRKFKKRELKQNESVKVIYFGKIKVNPLWVRMNELNPSDILWLTGTEDSMILTVGGFHSTVW